jgi:hypothetical protein
MTSACVSAGASVDRSKHFQVTNAVLAICRNGSDTPFCTKKR